MRNLIWLQVVHNLLAQTSLSEEPGGESTLNVPVGPAVFTGLRMEGAQSIDPSFFSSRCTIEGNSGVQLSEWCFLTSTALCPWLARRYRLNCADSEYNRRPYLTRRKKERESASISRGPVSMVIRGFCDVCRNI